MKSPENPQSTSGGVSPAFYIAGGTLPTHTPSYVPRQADQELLEGLNAGQFCYVLTSRQMGKSSLMVRTAARLREQGTAVAVLDLTAIGQNLSPDQWYDGLLNLLARSLDLEDEMEEFWLRQERLSPLQRWMAALREVALAHLPGKIVLFLDEIDAVRSLPFSVDEFFAAIRECYNRRSEDPEYERLTFCLLGVATPGDLIREVRTTPFNIGRRVVLTDFSRGEASVLEGGLGGVGLLERVLYWTGGHPYLTQRLCQAVASLAGEEPRTAATVDRLCGELFLASGLREQEDNLVFVRDRILRSEEDLAGLLTLYGEVLGGKRVADTEGSSQVSVLKLSGVVRVESGRLRVRNRLYERVFGKDWVREQMPDAEFRRQKAAYQRGLVRAVSVFGIVLAVVGGLAVYARIQARRAIVGERKAVVLRKRAEVGERAARQERYAAEINLAQQALAEDNLPRTLELVEKQIPQPGEEDLRGFEWYYLWRRCQGDQVYTFPKQKEPASNMIYSPDGRLLASGSHDKAVILWDAATKQQKATLDGAGRSIIPLAFSPDGQQLITWSDAEKPADCAVKIWNLTERRVVKTVYGPLIFLGKTIRFSAEGWLLAAMTPENAIRIWNLKTGKIVRDLGKQKYGIRALAFSPNGKLIAAGDFDSGVRLWSLDTGKPFGSPFIGHTHPVYAVMFSGDGKFLFSGSFDNTLRVWEVASGRVVKILRGHNGPPNPIMVSPNGKILATGSTDRTIRLWEIATLTLKEVQMGHTGEVDAIAFSPDSNTLVTCGRDATMRLWDVNRKTDAETFQVAPGAAPVWLGVTFSPNGQWLATGGGDGVITIWEAATGRVVSLLKGNRGTVVSLAFSADGTQLAAGIHLSSHLDGPGEVRVWDVRRRQLLRPPFQTASGVKQVLFSSDGRSVVAATVLGWIKRWELPSGKVLNSLTGARIMDGMAFSPDGTTLAYSHSDAQTIHLLNLATGHETVSPTGIGLCHSLVFTPDGRRLITGAFSGRVHLWELSTNRVTSFQAHRTSIHNILLFPDGKTLVTCGIDRVMKLWDVATQRERVTFVIGDQPTRAAVSPDGNTLVNLPLDGKLHLFRATPQKDGLK